MARRIRKKLIIVALGIAVAAVLVRSQSPSYEANEASVETAAGKALFDKHCGACHQSDGMGFEGAPPLVGSSWVAGSERRLIRIVLHGMRGPITVGEKTYNLEMPGFGHILSNWEIASLLSFIRKRWGKTSQPISAETVNRVRTEAGDRSDYWTAEELLGDP